MCCIFLYSKLSWLNSLPEMEYLIGLPRKTRVGTTFSFKIRKIWFLSEKQIDSHHTIDTYTLPCSHLGIVLLRSKKSLHTIWWQRYAVEKLQFFFSCCWELCSSGGWMLRVVQKVNFAAENFTAYGGGWGGGGGGWVLRFVWELRGRCGLGAESCIVGRCERGWE